MLIFERTHGRDALIVLTDLLDGTGHEEEFDEPYRSMALALNSFLQQFRAMHGDAADDAYNAAFRVIDTRVDRYRADTLKSGFADQTGSLVSDLLRGAGLAD